LNAAPHNSLYSAFVPIGRTGVPLWLLEQTLQSLTVDSSGPVLGMIAIKRSFQNVIESFERHRIVSTANGTGERKGINSNPLKKGKRVLHSAGNGTFDDFRHLMSLGKSMQHRILREMIGKITLRLLRNSVYYYKFD
jgi:hypothetical protein